jgi:large subunit ribosomal protein L31e
MTEYRRYIIPLRRAFETSPHTKRAPKAIKVLREFVKRHSKMEEVIISNKVNELIWKNGIRNIPRKVEVIVAIEKNMNKAFVYLPEEVEKVAENEGQKSEG